MLKKYKFIYCKGCKDFYLNYSMNFGNGQPACPKCYSQNIDVLNADSFTEMVKIERTYKIYKLKK